MTETWFDNLPVIGKLPPEEIVDKLREMGDEKTATELENLQYYIYWRLR